MNERRGSAGDDAMPLRLSAQVLDAEVVITLQGDLDLAGHKALLDLVADQPVEGRALELKASELSFMDSTGCKALLDVHSSASERGATSVVVAVSPAGPVHRILELTGLLSQLDVRLTEAPRGA